jgi:hypothetical protein
LSIAADDVKMLAFVLMLVILQLWLQQKCFQQLC